MMGRYNDFEGINNFPVYCVHVKWSGLADCGEGGVSWRRHAPLGDRERRSICIHIVLCNAEQLVMAHRRTEGKLSVCMARMGHDVDRHSLIPSVHLVLRIW